MISLEQLFADLIQQTNQHSFKFPPVHLWHPEKTGDMDLRIDREGRWIHESVEIKRPSMVKLFSSLLKVEDGQYFLVTPTEKWQIEVDIAPFFIIDSERMTRKGVQVISLTTSTEEQVLLGKDNPLIIDSKPPKEPLIPLVHIRNNLNALVSRAVYYQLVDWGYEKSNIDGKSQLILDSLNCQFSLGDFLP
jgi:hypothetical protein